MQRNNPLFGRNIRTRMGDLNKILTDDPEKVLAAIKKGELKPSYFKTLFTDGYLANQDKFKELLRFLHEKSLQDEKLKPFLHEALPLALGGVLTDLSQKRVDVCCDLVMHVLSLADKDQVCKVLASDVKFREIVARVLKMQSEMDSTILIGKLIQAAIKKLNPALLADLDSSHHELAMRLIATMPLEQLIIAKILLDITDEPARIAITEMLQQFTNGFGRINYLGGLLTCAQLRYNKGESFHTTVLRNDASEEGKSEFAQYLKVLKSGPRPIEVSFILAGAHWSAGIIKIDESGHAKLFVTDSLGAFGNSVFPSQAVKDFAAAFPGDPVYVSLEKRQNAGAGCSVFSIDDVNQFRTLAQYLEEKYKKTGIFGYIEDHLVEEKVTYPDLNGITIRACYVPLALNRAMQSKKILAEVDDDTLIKTGDIQPTRSLSERQLVINKKAQTVFANIQKNFRCEDINDKSSFQNMRASDILEKFAYANAAFLIAHKDNLTAVQSAMHDFSLEGFIKRIQQAVKKTASTARYENESSLSTLNDMKPPIFS